MNAADREVLDSIAAHCVRVVDAQQVMPIVLALEVLTAALCKDPACAAGMAEAFRRSTDSCPPDTAGQKFLVRLAALATAPPSSEPRPPLKLV